MRHARTSPGSHGRRARRRPRGRGLDRTASGARGRRSCLGGRSSLRARRSRHHHRELRALARRPDRGRARGGPGHPRRARPRAPPRRAKRWSSLAFAEPTGFWPSPHWGATTGSTPPALAWSRSRPMASSRSATAIDGPDAPRGCRARPRFSRRHGHDGARDGSRRPSRRSRSHAGRVTGPLGGPLSLPVGARAKPGAGDVAEVGPRATLIDMGVATGSRKDV